MLDHFNREFEPRYDEEVERWPSEEELEADAEDQE